MGGKEQAKTGGEMKKTLKTLKVSMQEVLDEKNNKQWIMDVTGSFYEPEAPAMTMSVEGPHFETLIYALPISIEDLCK
jgi:hypothetical protein